MMVWQQWFYLVFALVGSFATVANIGKRREPYTPGLVVVLLILQAGLVALVLSI